MRSRNWFLTILSRCPKGTLKPEVTDGIREVRLGAYKVAVSQDLHAEQAGTVGCRTARPVVWELEEGDFPRQPDFSGVSMGQDMEIADGATVPTMEGVSL
jgi:hypothetical protein